MKKLKAANSLNEKTYNEVYPSGIGIICGLPKIHKSTIPLRPILSSVNHYSYKLSKFFIPLLTPLTTSFLIITESFSFVQKLLNSDIDSSNVVMASFDVTSLFTNIPVNETIEIIGNSLFSNCQFFNGLDRQKLLSLSVINCHFIFNGHLYQQVDGVAMGTLFHFLPMYSCPSMNKSGPRTVLLLSSLYSTDDMLMTAFFFSDP